ncbi:hypothetical protein OPV22_031674 [Ensete ventricosum]|uniref:Uncharacterized protein n=1 Tax=Ensete ventricosum TaxID=4639 RepID=A0AAV8PW31_ENSVE|nr:hypothetical protein OPV22_031674 [Ensete ventricosum]
MDTQRWTRFLSPPAEGLSQAKPETNDDEAEQHPSPVVEWEEHDGELSQPSDQRGARGVAEAATEQPAEVLRCDGLREQRQRSSSGREGRVRRPETDERPPPCLEELVTTSPRFRKQAGLSAARGFCFSMRR